MNKKIKYFGIYPLVLASIIFLIFYLTTPLKEQLPEVQIFIFLLFYFGMLAGWFFIYLTSEGWGGKETIIDNKLRKKIIFISILISTVLTILLVVFGLLVNHTPFSAIISDWYVLLFYWLLFLAIPWMIMDTRIWLKNRNK
jgi:hypothetical protein